MARMTRAQQEIELQARMTAEHAARMERYDFFHGVKQSYALDSCPRKVQNWTPAIVIGPATELWLKPGSLWRCD